MESKEEIFDLHQIDYHYSGDEKTLGRYSEYNLDGINKIIPEVTYMEHVNNQKYNIYKNI